MVLAIPPRAVMVVGLFALCLGGEPSTDPKVVNITCPSRCEDLFGRLDAGVQEVDVQLRGEPKSGTTTSGIWAWRGLSNTCLFLQSLYGKRSCHTEKAKDVSQYKIVFTPQLNEDDAPCACDGVKRVKIGFSEEGKHALPVRDGCTFSHIKGLPKASHNEVCLRRDGLKVENVADLWQCVDEAGCTFNDESLQLAVMRDPRAVTVSSYFHRVRRKPHVSFEFDDSVDIYFQNMLQKVCMWTSLRHLLFTKVLANQSELFMLEDLMIDPVDWYGRFFSFVGIHLPFKFVYGMAQTASGRDGSMGYSHMDAHPGGYASNDNRTFRDELGPESLAMMDDVVRLWLPPVLLKRFGIEL